MPQPLYPSPVTEVWLLGAGGSGGLSSGSFGSIDIGMRRQGLPNAVFSGMSGGEQQAAGVSLAKMVFNSAGAGMQMAANTWNSFKPNQVSLYHFNFNFDSEGYMVDIMALPDFGVGRNLKTLGSTPDWAVNGNIPKLPVQLELGINRSGEMSLSGGYSFSVLPGNATLLKGNRKFKWPWR